MTPEFLITTIVLTATPGTGALFTIAAGLARGARAGVVAALGCTLGIVPHLVLALSGAAVLLAASPMAFAVLTWLGVAYLLYMAWGMWKDAGKLAPAGDAPDAARPALKVIGSAILVNLLNPKLTLFFFVFLPMFVDPSSDGVVLRMAGLGLVIMGVTLVIFAVYGITAGVLRTYVIERPAVVRAIGRGFSVTFVALAGMLAFAHP